MPITIQPISPIAVSLFGLEIRWYALAYIAAFIAGYWLMRKLAVSSEQSAGNKQKTADCYLLTANSKKNWDDLLTYVIIGTIAGGRLGYVLFYNLGFFIRHPLEIFAIWNGGMSFHGGLLGVIVSVFLFAKRIGRQKQSLELRVKSLDKPNSSTLQNGFAILDLMAAVAPIGLFFGRIANFINMEVMGRATDRPWGIVFAGAPDQTPRHASPLYEAALEGVLLFAVMWGLWRFTRLRERTGALSGIFAMTYAAVRIFAEQFRQPDAQLGFLTGWGLTMGQLLSGLMLAAGAILFTVAMRKK